MGVRNFINKVLVPLPLLFLLFATTHLGAQVAPATPQAPPAPAVPAPPQVSDAEKYRIEHEQQLRVDWAQLKRYEAANLQVGPPATGQNRVVFYGDSITDAWIGVVPEFFQGKPYLDRGISGQTTPQMLVRMRQDVVDLQPRVVVILAGTNDIAGNTGPSTPEMIEDNFKSMVEIARANGIQPVIASILPASDYPWKPGMEPGPKIVSLNTWLKSYAEKNGLVYLDYYAAMVNDKLGLPANLSSDGVHPNKAGYAIMGPLAEKAVAAALSAPPPNK
jgi:lysophospholipase L1-like esterase